MSKKRKKAQAEKLNFTPVYVLGILASVAVIVMVVVLSVMNAPKQGEFIPPPFEDAAMQGIPDVPEELQYSSPYRDGMAYRFSVCANVKMDGSKAVVYFTNAEENSVYLKLRVLDKDGNILGETGLLKPGEYVKGVELDKDPSAETTISLKIMSYEPDTYMSEGSVILKTEIGE